MTALRISEVARQAGVAPSAIRYYEDIGLLSPPRSPNGYRVYDDTDVERLAFITRAKRLDISLDDVRGLLVAWESDQCATVQGNMAVLVAARLKEAEHRIAELTGLAEQLRSVQNRLRAEPRDGACDEFCACSTADTIGVTPLASAKLFRVNSLGGSCEASVSSDLSVDLQPDFTV